MDKYIDREAFLATKRKVYCEDCDRRKNSKGKMVYDIGDAPCRACGVDDMLDDVEDFPAADVRPVVRAHWTDHRTIEHDGEWYCSNCGNEVTICMCGKDKTWRYPFCPNCGADMRGDNDDT